MKLTVSASILFAILFAVTKGQGAGGKAWASTWRFGRGKQINFAGMMDMQKVCEAINAAYSPGQLSDAMGAAMAYFRQENILPTIAAKPNSGMQCLYTWAFTGTAGDAGNKFGDLYDTVIEGPHQRGFFAFNPCADPLFCQCGAMMGMDPPTAMAHMASPMNNLIRPMAPLGQCVKRMLCQKNPRDMRCSGRNPLMNPMMNMMGGRGNVRNNNLMNNAIAVGMNKMATGTVPNFNGMMGMNQNIANTAAPQLAKVKPQQKQNNVQNQGPSPNMMEMMMQMMSVNPMMAQLWKTPNFANTFRTFMQQQMSPKSQASGPGNQQINQQGQQQQKLPNQQQHQQQQPQQQNQQQNQQQSQQNLQQQQIQQQQNQQPQQNPQQQNHQPQQNQQQQNPHQQNSHQPQQHTQQQSQQQMQQKLQQQMQQQQGRNMMGQMPFPFNMFSG